MSLNPVRSGRVRHVRRVPTSDPDGKKLTYQGPDLARLIVALRRGAHASAELAARA
jgi:hypothetical protein